MAKSPKRVSPFRRFAALTSCSLFLLFLSLSQPHRVHHFFEGLNPSHHETEVDSDHHDNGQNRTQPVQTDCVLQSVAHNCHVSQAELVGLPFVDSHLQSFHPQTSQWVDL